MSSKFQLSATAGLKAPTANLGWPMSSPQLLILWGGWWDLKQPHGLDFV